METKTVKKRITVSAKRREARNKKIVALRESGMTFEAVADKVGMSQAGVGIIYRKHLEQRGSE